MRIRIVDAFTDRPFAGNPAGVLPSTPSRTTTGSSRSPWRSTTPRPRSPTACPRAARPTGRCAGSPRPPRSRCAATRRSPLPTSCTPPAPTRGGAVRHPQWRPRRDAGRGRLDHPGLPHRAAHPGRGPEGRRRGPGDRALAVLDTGPDIGDLLVEVADEKTVRGLTPDHKALAAYSERGIIATARAEDAAAATTTSPAASSPTSASTRTRSPAAPHTALAPFWSERLGCPCLTGMQASPRSGRVRTELRGERTLLSGRAVTVIEGELLA